MTGPETASPLRCPACGRRNPADARGCVGCRYNLVLLCECGAEVSALATRCDACGAARIPARYPAVRRTVRRVVRVALVVVVIALVTVLVRYRLRSAAESSRAERRAAVVEALAGRDDERARAEAAALLAEDPADARAWQLLAYAGRALGRPRSEYMGHAQKAIELRRSLVPTLEFLAREHYRAGEYDEASRYALRATQARPETSRSWLLVAEAELRRPTPDTALAVRALHRARELGGPDLELRARIAELRLWMLGSAPPDSLPPDVQIELMEVEAALRADALSEQPELRPASAAWLRATLLVAAGRPRLADRQIALCEKLMPENAPDEERARVLLLRARSRWLAGEVDEELALLRRAIALAPAGAVPGEIATRLDADGRGETAVEILSGSGAGTPAAAQALASLYLANGDPRSALVVLDSAEERPSLLLVRGDTLIALGDVVAARNAYLSAASAAPDPVPASIGAALTSLAETGEHRAAALAEAEAALVALDDPERPRADIVYALARVRDVRDDLPGACDALDRAAAADPWSATIQLARASAFARTPAPHAAVTATRSALRAIDLRPYDARTLVPALYVLLATGEVRSCVWRATSFLERTPQHVQVLRLRATANLRLNRPDDAATDLAAAVAGGDDDPAAFALLVEALHRSGQPEKARDVIRTASDRLGNAGARAARIADAIHAGGATESAAAAGDAGTTIDAMVLVATGRRVDAITLLRRLHAASPADAEAGRLLVLTLVSGAPGPAEISEAREVTGRLDAPPGSGLPDLLRGATELASGDAQAASVTLARAALRRPRDADAQFLAGAALHDLGDVDGALARFRLALSVPGTTWTLGPAIAARLVASAAETEQPEHRRELLVAAVRADPRSLPAAEALFVADRDAGRFADAAYDMERLVEAEVLDPAGQRRARLLAFEARMALGDLVAMTEHLEHLAREGEEDVVFSLTLRGVMLTKSGRADEAEHLLREAVAAAPAQALPTLALIEALLAQERYADARAAAGEWSALHPGDDRLAGVITRVLARHGALDEARAEALALVARNPGPQQLRQLAWIEVQRGDAESALSAIDAVRATAAEPFRTQLDLLRAEVQLRGKNDHAGAEAAARAVLARGESVPASLTLHASVLAAEALLQRAGPAGGGAGARLLISGVVRRTNDRFDGPGESDLLPRVRFAQGVIAVGEGREREARAKFRACLEADPTHASAANNLAWLLAHSPGGAREAVAFASLATRVTPRDGNCWQTLGVALAADARSEDAVAAYARALDLLPATGADAVRAETLLLRAESLAALGRAAEAREDATRAIALGAGSDIAQRAQQFIDAR